MKYEILTKDGRAKRATMETVHGTIQTPVFMNVGTVAAITGAVSTDDLRSIGLCNDVIGGDEDIALSILDHGNKDVVFVKVKLVKLKFCTFFT